MTEFKVGDKVRLKAEHKREAKVNSISAEVLTIERIKEYEGGRDVAVFSEGGSCWLLRLEHVPPAVTIDPERTYRTRDGREVRIYATDGAGDFPVHGAFKYDGEWLPDKWTESGAAYTGDDQSDLDLIEVKPEREGFVNVYHVPGEQGHGPVYANKAEADHYAMPGRIACLHLKFREGDGLDGGK